jgi:hypothetical protein
MSGASTSTPPLRLHGGHADSFTFGLLLWFILFSYCVLSVFVSFLVLMLCFSQLNLYQRPLSSAVSAVRTRQAQNH